MKERLLDGEMIVLSKHTNIMLEKLNILLPKKGIIKEYRHRPLTKTNLKCIIELNVKGKTIKLMWKITLGVNVYNLCYGSNILDTTQSTGLPRWLMVKN